MALIILPVPMFSDNYAWLIHDPPTGMTAVVDPGEPEPVEAALNAQGWQLSLILITHHHADHVGGNERLKARTGCKIVGPKAEARLIPGLDNALISGDQIDLGPHKVQIIAVPGHTLGHIAYFIPNAHIDGGALFCGDALFSLGCGRLFEGTPAMAWETMQHLRRLPDLTRIYCAHEYSQSNGRFAVSIDQKNSSLLHRVQEIDVLRERGEPTLPALLGSEKAANPFLRADDPVIAKLVGLDGADAVAVFANLRRRKDQFS